MEKFEIDLPIKSENWNEWEFYGENYTLEYNSNDGGSSDKHDFVDKELSNEIKDSLKIYLR